MLDFSIVSNFLTRYSYLGIALFVAGGGYIIPIPEEIFLLLIGYLAAAGVINVWIALAVCFVMILLSDFFVYNLAAHGSALIARYQGKIKPEKMDKYEALMREHAGKTIFLLRFVFGVRFLSILVAGSLRVKPRLFLTADFFALLIYVPALIFVGFHFHNSFVALVTTVEGVRRLMSFVTLITGGVLITLYIRHRFLEPKNKKDE